MEELKVYISNIDPNLLNSIGGRPGELIALIQSEKFISEKALATHLFDGKWSYQNYLNLKNKTRKILSAFFLISPPKKNNELLKKIRQCRQIYFTAMYLIEIGKRAEAHKMLIKAGKIAEEYGLTRLAYQSAIELMAAASLGGKRSKYVSYNKLAESLFQDLEAEDAAEREYYELVLSMNSKKGLSKKLLDKCLEQVAKYDSNSVKFLQYSCMIAIFKHLHTADYQAIVQAATKALRRLQNRKGVYRSVLQFIVKNQAIAHTALGEYDQAERLLRQAEEYAPAHSYNLAILRYYQAVNALHSGDYQAAYQLYRQQRKTKYLQLREQWQVMAVYMYFLKKVGRLDTGTDRFPIGRYLNEAHEVAHDKKGNNLNVRIGELLYHLVNDRGRFIDRVEAIDAYSYKHLRGPDTRRAKWFIHILCLMPQADFNPLRLVRLAKRYVEYLQDNPLHMGDKLAVEIIPFNILLSILLKELQRKVA
ncbi:MAG: tetratricopeptide repeat protein [Bacteroidota bacterium]